MLQPVHAGICSTPTEKASVHCSSSEQDFLWNGPSPLLWTFLDQGLHTGCCHLFPLHPTSVCQEASQGSKVKLCGIFLLMFATSVCHYKKPSKECTGERLLLCNEMGAKSGLSSLSSLCPPSHQPWYLFFLHHFRHPTSIPGSKSSSFLLPVRSY